MKLIKRAAAGMIATSLVLGVVACEKKEAPAVKKEAVEKKADNEVAKKKGNIFNVTIGDAQVMGPADAPVTVINFSDFQCPFSKRSYTMMQKVMKDYKGKVRYVFKHFPLHFHKQARMASRAAYAAGNQGKFWEMYDKLFENQKQISDDSVKGWAKSLGLDMTTFEKDYLEKNDAGKRTDSEKTVAEDMAQGRKFGVRGTPTMFINGVKFVGANSKKVEAIIKEQLAEGEKLKAKGVKDVYTELVKNGLKKAPKKVPQIAKDIYKLEIPKHAPIWGKKDAPITMVIIDDFECPFCARHYKTTEALKKEYEDTLRIVYIQNPLGFHKKAKPASYASIAAQNQGKFWEMYSKLFSDQKGWRKAADLNAYFENAAKELGLDITKFKKDMASAETKKIVEDDIKLAMNMGSRGTPGNFVNGRFIGGAYPKETFDQVFKEELERAKPFMDKGLKGDALYAELVKNGKEKIERKSRKEKEDPNKVYKVDLSGHEPVKGSEKAPITIVEFSEHQCPFCRRGSNTMNQLVEEYKGKVKVLFKHQPLGFHKQARPAAKFSIAAHKLYGDKKFYEVSSHLFNNQKEWTKDHMTTFEGYAKKFKMDWEKVKKEMESPETEAVLKKDMAAAAKLGVRGVPAFFVNGKKLSGAQPLPRFKAVIDEMLNPKKAPQKAGK